MALLSLKRTECSQKSARYKQITALTTSQLTGWWPGVPAFLFFQERPSASLGQGEVLVSRMTECRGSRDLAELGIPNWTVCWMWHFMLSLSMECEHKANQFYRPTLFWKCILSTMHLMLKQLRRSINGVVVSVAYQEGSHKTWLRKVLHGASMSHASGLSPSLLKPFQKARAKQMHLLNFALLAWNGSERGGAICMAHWGTVQNAVPWPPLAILLAPIGSNQPAHN